MLKYKEHIILGIDPGYKLLGFGLIKSVYKTAKIIATGLVKNNNKIFENIIDIIEEYIANELAIETTFRGKNIQSTILLSRVQGVVMSAGFYNKIPITEYTPKQIKRSITGTGNASKEQVAYMLKKILFVKNKYLLKNIDASDGLAIAVCHHLTIYNILCSNLFFYI